MHPPEAMDDSNDFDAELYTDPENAPTGKCPTCHVEIEDSDLRYDGYSWRHHNPEAEACHTHHVWKVPPGATDTDADAAND